MKYIFSLLLVLLFAAQPIHAAPASLSFDPVDIQTTLGKPFEIDVNIFTGGLPVVSTDIWLSYNPEIIKPVLKNTKKGTLFKTIEIKEIESGKLYLYGMQEHTKQAKSVEGIIAKIQFVPVINGTTHISFDCDASRKATSQIITSDKNLSNMISCPATVAHSASVRISGVNILGVSTENNLLNQLSYILGIIVLIFSVMLFVRYQHIRHEIS